MAIRDWLCFVTLPLAVVQYFNISIMFNVSTISQTVQFIYQQILEIFLRIKKEDTFTLKQPIGHIKLLTFFTESKLREFIMLKTQVYKML
jgi:hypothetical protein